MIGLPGGGAAMHTHESGVPPLRDDSEPPGVAVGEDLRHLRRCSVKREGVSATGAVLANSPTRTSTSDNLIGWLPGPVSGRGGGSELRPSPAPLSSA